MAVALKGIAVALLADFALKLFPVVTSHVLAVHLRVPLALDPVLEALEVDEAHRAAALARQNERVGLLLLGAPAEAAIDGLALLPKEHTNSTAEVLLT